MTLKDFSFNTNKSNLAEITLSSRYPKEGYSLNTESEMTVYILEGNVTLGQEGSTTMLQKGDAVLVEVNKKYFWEPLPDVSLLIFSTPPWTPAQVKQI